jgi:peroxiredoxin
MRAICFALALVVVSAVAPAATANEATPVGRKIDGFSLRDFRGKPLALSELDDKKLIVVAFLGTECPLAKLYGPRLAKLQEEFAPQGVAFVGISSNQQDSVTELEHYARTHGIEFPILKDLGNQVADAFGAQRTPEAFVLDADRKIRYWGRIDDQYGFQETRIGYQLKEPRRRDLAEAITELLAGKDVSQPVTAVSGCLIGRVREPVANAEVTYSNQISRLFNKQCVLCHREGQIAPFALTSYQEAVGWAEMIREVVEQQRMPPWHADAPEGRFSNDCRLSEEEKQLVYRWVDAGAPEGDPNQLPEPPQFPEGWMIPEPDEIIYMRDEPYMVPAEGTVEYQRFVVDPGWKEDRWLTAIEPKPGNPAVVHHVVMYIQPPDGPSKGRTGRLRTDWLAAFAPGLRPQVLPDEYARLIPAGSKLIFELHYTPNGVAQEDRSYLGVKFADPKKVKRELVTKNAGNFTFRIPPNNPNYKVESTFTFRDNTILWSVSPHMHLRGKDFYYEVQYPDGKVEPILSVPRYDFAWQTTYLLTEPRVLPKGSKLHCVAHFDNSEGNLNNPDPSQEVRWGEQTWEEMMFGWFEMALADQDLTQPPPEPIARVKEFNKSVESGAIQVDDQLTQMSRRAGRSEEDFKFFSYYLVDLVPQLDRVCITYVEDGKLKLRNCEELNGFRGVFRSPATQLKAEGQGLAEFLSKQDPVVIDDLAKSEGSLIKKLNQKGLVSSLHVPVQIDGHPATVNFWSCDQAAFPPKAVEFLGQISQRLAEGEKD